jgi:hypothetical protein
VSISASLHRRRGRVPLSRMTCVDSSVQAELTRPEVELTRDGKRCLPCPHRIAEQRLRNLPYSCNGIGAETMAPIRRHLIRAHSIFVRLCPACNVDIFSKSDFDGSHGDRCEITNKQQKGTGQETQWYTLYEQIERIVQGGMSSARRSSASNQQNQILM